MHAYGLSTNPGIRTRSLTPNSPASASKRPRSGPSPNNNKRGNTPSNPDPSRANARNNVA